MAHSDDEGLILPPKIAPIQVVIVPIYKGDEQKAQLDARGQELTALLKKNGIRVKFDASDNNRPGWKFAQYELKGVPVRIAMGMRDLENQTVEIARRDLREKTVMPLEGIAENITALLDDIQRQLYQKAKDFREQHITRADTWEEFVRLLDEKGGFLSAHWDGTAETEQAIKDKTKATIRCIPLDNPQEDGLCILTGKRSRERVLFARAY
jgi:prolyl-tRNA synthetase